MALDRKLLMNHVFLFLSMYFRPTMFVNDKHMYFGNDRLVLLERRIISEANGYELNGTPSFAVSRL